MDNSTSNMAERLVQYLDGELKGADKDVMEQHLASDKNLRDELDSLIATREAVKMYGLQQKVSGIHQQMMQEMKTPAGKINSTRRILRLGIAVAASVVLIVGSIIGYNFYSLSFSPHFLRHPSPGGGGSQSLRQPANDGVDRQRLQAAGKVGEGFVQDGGEGGILGHGLGHEGRRHIAQRRRDRAGIDIEHAVGEAVGNARVTVMRLVGVKHHDLSGPA